MKRDVIKTSTSVMVVMGVVAGTTFYSEAAQPIYIGNATENLNIRSGASTKYKIIGQIPKGKNIEVMSKPNSTGWVKIRYTGKEGWCSGKYIKEKTTKIGYVSGVRRLSLREKASTESKAFGFVYEGEKVEVIDYTGDFARVKYSGRIYYVLKRRIVHTNPAKTMYISGAWRKGLYEKASTKSKMLDLVYEGEKVTVVGKKGNYLHAIYKGQRGYLYNEDVLSKNPAKTMYIAGVWRKGLYETWSTKSKTLDLVYEGEKVTVVGKKGNYYHTIYNGKRGYLYKDNVVSSNPITYGYVGGVESIDVMNGSNEVIGCIVEGQKVKMFGKKNGKVRIAFNNKTGFILDKGYIRTYQTKVVTDTKSLSVYKSNSTSSEIIGSISEGIKVDVYEVSGDWSKIKYGSSYGYIQSKYIKDVKIIKKDVAIRSSKSTKGSVVYNAKKGEKVIVESYSDGWAKVKINSKSGYIKNEYLSTFGKYESTEAPSGTGYLNTIVISDPNVNKRYIIGEKVAVYKGTSLDSGIYGYLKKGDNVEYISVSGEYAKVKVNDSVIGYVKSTEISYKDINAKNTSSVVSKKISKTHDEYVDSQVGKPYINIDEVRYYSNPLNFSLSNNEHKYQFLKLDRYNKVNAYELNEYLNKLPVSSGKKAIFKNQAEAFIKAAKKYNIDVVYLVAHTMLETGRGSSTLAQGVVVTEDAKGNKIDPVTVYNLYGIGAVDESAVSSGAKTAYTLGWTSIPKAIEGAAKWISLGIEANEEIGLKKSDGYIHSSVFTDQYNLYSMRFDYVKGWHQYATDEQWSLKISRLMNELSYLYEGANLVFEKIEYAPNVVSKIYDADSRKDMIANSNAILRSGPSENFRKIGDLNKGEVVSVIGESDLYWVLDINGEKMYVLKSKLSNTKIKNIDELEIDENEKIDIESIDDVCEENVDVDIVDIENVNESGLEANLEGVGHILENEYLNIDVAFPENEYKLEE